MMKTLGLIAFLPLTVMAAKIPVDRFDQSKLEYLLRHIPVAFVEAQDMTDFVRKHYTFPETSSSFKIICTADHYRSSPIPSRSECSVDVFGVKQGDEYVIQVKDSSTVASLYKVMPTMGSDMRKIYSTERVYGQAYAGDYRDLFRYKFSCSEKSCEMTFSTKEARY